VRLSHFAVTTISLVTLPIAAQVPADLASSVASRVPALERTYLDLHRNPELSRQEQKTSAFLAGELRKLGSRLPITLAATRMELRGMALLRFSKMALGRGYCCARTWTRCR
jgi:hypothetical protein